MVALSEQTGQKPCVLVLGHGVIGRALVQALRIADSPIALVNVADPNVSDAFPVDILAEPGLIRNYHYVVNTIPLHSPERLIPLLVACHKFGVHYLDTNEDRSISKIIRTMSVGQNDILMAPHCGLAPGAINVMGAHMARISGVEELDLRAGALTRIVDNEYLYTPTWSPAGMVNQTLNDFEVIENGRLATHKSVFIGDGVPLGHFKHFYHDFYIDGIRYECFPTSGGLGTMVEMPGLQSLVYRSIRLYKHSQAMRSLIHSLNFDRPSIIRKLDQQRMNVTDDYVFTIVKTNGPKQVHKYMWIMKVEASDYMGIPMTAIQKCTVGGVAAVLDMHVKEQVPSGFLHQHNIDWKDYERNQYIEAVGYRGGRYGIG